ncbi:hypothetical protein [Burkholderia guangdongensis]|uniref:hypothetical protein n=1 Tax=Burkholderia guangdongensis TaxID=1792500 RepID=UPI0015CC4441|nr:hypothetical protein [Burkholderia guangdongensis]
MNQLPMLRAAMPGPAGTSGACITVAHPLFSMPLALARLDRHGLAFRASGALPALDGLPRVATLLADDAPPCSLRLVIRDIARSNGDLHDVTMQPSCAASDELLWRTLRSWPSYRRIDGPLAPVFDESDDATAPPPALTCGMPTAVRVTRGAAFRLACRGDALFLSDWLEYHFDELRALTQQHAPQLRLKRLERKLTDATVGIRFVYDMNGHTMRHALNDCARAACAWIEEEMRDKYALPLAQAWIGEYRLCDAAGG